MKGNSPRVVFKKEFYSIGSHRGGVACVTIFFLLEGQGAGLSFADKLLARVVPESPRGWFLLPSPTVDRHISVQLSSTGCCVPHPLRSGSDPNKNITSDPKVIGWRKWLVCSSVTLFLCVLTDPVLPPHASACM